MAITDKVAVERRNLSPAQLYEHAVRRNEAAIVSTVQGSELRRPLLSRASIGLPSPVLDLMQTKPGR